jgi:hypothetical protein
MNLNFTRRCLKGFISLFLIAVTACSGHDQTRFKRLSHNPIIAPSHLPGADGENINGPSLIKAPDWLPDKLGKYYLYFAHHQGTYIRLAYADDLNGPWTVYEPGSLKTTDCRCREVEELSNGKAKAHIASPDVHIDEENRQIVLYFHCPLVHKQKGGQYSFRAVSNDGIHFQPDTTVLGISYFRVFDWQGTTYAIARAGIFYRSTDGGLTFEEGNNPFDGIQNKENYLRHAAVKVQDEKLLVFYSRIGDTPERILLSEIDLAGDWKAWKASEPVTVAEPATEYEGVNLPLSTSEGGSHHGLIRELRDPGFYEEDGKWYLLYTVGGEHGIGIGELNYRK